MPVPKRKRSRPRRDKRFANKGMQPKALTKCHNCSEAIMPHQVCKGCGFYKGTKILTTKTERHVQRQQVRSSKEAAKSAAPAAPVEEE